MTYLALAAALIAFAGIVGMLILMRQHWVANTEAETSLHKIWLLNGQVRRLEGNLSALRSAAPKYGRDPVTGRFMKQPDPSDRHTERHR